MTIYALSTAPGTAGLAVVRLSGPRALEALNTIVKNKDFTHSTFKKCKFYHPVKHQQLDSGLAVYFKGPTEFFKLSKLGELPNFSSKIWSYNHFIGRIYLLLKRIIYFTILK